MLLAPVDYYRADSIADAASALSETDGARLLAGGQSLISLLKLRATQVDLLIDISRLDELRFVDKGDDGSVRIGAGMTYDELEHSDELQAAQPIISKVAARTVDQQIRNRGTIGGNVCHNDPINNFPVLSVALGAVMHLTGSGGDRDVSAEDFYTGFFSTAVGEDEILHSITFPALGDGYSVGWNEVEIGEAAARAVAVVRTDNGSIADARLALGCLPVPTLRPEAASALEGVATDPEAVAGATADIADGIDFFPDDPDGTSDYRRALAPVVAKRAVLDAIGGGADE
ncbi:MAG TPA: FAD binding domain-containing protein [Acidimicrobiia bacterium]